MNLDNTTQSYSHDDEMNVELDEMMERVNFIYMVQYIGANIIGGIFVKILKTTFCIYCNEVGW